MARLFGTDGVRGVANESLTPELAYHLGRAAAVVLGREQAHPTFLVGMDTRLSGSMLADVLAAGIASVGGRCCMAGRCLLDESPPHGCGCRHFGVAQSL